MFVLRLNVGGGVSFFAAKGYRSKLNHNLGLKNFFGTAVQMR